MLFNDEAHSTVNRYLCQRRPRRQEYEVPQSGRRLGSQLSRVQFKAKHTLGWAPDVKRSPVISHLSYHCQKAQPPRPILAPHHLTEVSEDWFTLVHLRCISQPPPHTSSVSPLHGVAEADWGGGQLQISALDYSFDDYSFQQLALSSSSLLRLPKVTNHPQTSTSLLFLTCR